MCMYPFPALPKKAILTNSHTYALKTRNNKHFL